MAILGYITKKDLTDDLKGLLLTQTDLLEPQREKLAINLAEFFENWLKELFGK